MHNIVAIIVTFNRKNYLKKCIQSLMKQTYSFLDILVIDNASTDGTSNEVHKLCTKNPSILYVNTGKNVGGAGGFSYGIRYAIEIGYDYLWIMDDDTFPTETALAHLLKTKEQLKDQFGFLASYVKWTDGTACKMNIPGISLQWRNNIEQEFESRIFRLDTASFVSILLKSSVVKRVGLPIKEFFIWADDLEYTSRISKQYPSYFVYDSQVIHEMKSNQATSILEASSERLERYAYLYRNRYYIASHGAKRDKFLFWLMVKNTISDLYKSNLKDKYKRIGIVLKSSLKGLLFNPKIEYIADK